MLPEKQETRDADLYNDLPKILRKHQLVLRSKKIDNSHGYNGPQHVQDMQDQNWLNLVFDDVNIYL